VDLLFFLATCMYQGLLLAQLTSISWKGFPSVRSGMCILLPPGETKKHLSLDLLSLSLPFCDDRPLASISLYLMMRTAIVKVVITCDQLFEAWL